MASILSLLASYEGQGASAAASASIANLEKMVRLQKKALDQAIADLTVAREKSARKGDHSHTPTAEEVAEFVARSAARAERSDLPGAPDGGGPRFSDEDIRLTTEYIIRAARRARGEEMCDEIPARERAIDQRVDDPEATSAFILAAARKAQSKT
jgi:hypothetical protein